MVSITSQAIHQLIAKLDAAYGDGSLIDVKDFDNVLIDMGLLDDNADPSDRTTSEWGARVYSRNRIRQKFNREAVEWSPPLQLRIVQHASPKNGLGKMKLVRHNEHAVERASDRANGAVTYFNGAAREARGLLRHYADVIHPVAQRILEDVVTQSELEAVKQEATQKYIAQKVDKARKLLGLDAPPKQHDDDEGK